MAPKNIVISLDGATFSILKNYLDTNQLSSDTGLGLLAHEGVFVPSTVITPSLTAPSHVALATGSTAARNNINANSFHLVRSPFNTNISGFGAPIGGYDALNPDGAHDEELPTAEPLWVRLREAGKKVVAATFPGADGVDVKLPGVTPPSILQPSEERTVDYTVPFGAFGGVGARGYSLKANDFKVDPAQVIAGLSTLGITSFSNVRVAELETIPATGQGSLTGGSSNPYALQVAAVDTTNDNVVNYNQLVVFDATRGLEAGSDRPPSTGSAVINLTDQTISPFFFEGSTNTVGASFILTNLAPDLSSVRLLRTSANYIPRPAESPEVIADVDDINTNVGFWRPQPDFRIAQRIAPGLADFSDIELETAYSDLVDTFVAYQTDVLLRSIEQNSDADLVLGYIEQPDGSGHQFLLTDPRQATNPSDPNSIGEGQDQAKIDRYATYVRDAYKAASDAVQRVIDAVGVDENGVPNSNIIITSDHGFAPFHTAVNMNNILTNAGFEPKQVRAVTSGPAVNIYINVKGREPDGVVEPSEYKALQQKVIETLEGLQDVNPNYATSAIPLFDKVYDRSVPDNPTVEDIITASGEFIGQDTGDVFALMNLGYNFDGFQSTVLRKGDAAPAEGQQPIYSVPTFYGAHGFDPTLPEMQASFIAAGPDFDPATLSDLSRTRSIDIAPTLLDLLNVEPAPTVEGESIFELRLSGEPVIGTPERDVLSVTGKGTEFLADDGDDLILATTSQGSNRVDASFGDDILILGGGDRILGGDGDDAIFVQSGGGNIITGGAGADQFWIAVGGLPEAVNTIADFVSDRDVLGIAGLDLNFGQLSIAQDGENVRITANGKDLAILRGITATDLSTENFAFV